MSRRTPRTQGIRQNRWPQLARFLSHEEIGRLHRVLDRQTSKVGREQADVIRLLLLTGGREGEIVRLRRSEVHDDTLALAEQEAQSRRVLLNS